MCEKVGLIQWVNPFVLESCAFVLEFLFHYIGYYLLCQIPLGFEHTLEIGIL